MSKQILEQSENNNPAIIHVEPEQAVKELLTSLKALESTKQEIKDKLEQDLLEQLELCEDRIAATEKEIKEIVSFEIQDTIKTEDGQAVYRKGNIRVSYNKDILDAIQDNKIREAIEPARKEIKTKGSVKIEIY